ncbi:MAG TPA: DNA polymerase III subunit delta' [Actinomycetes bacterium]|nr:DNA polymerase III subunit delta' [Actinomycetes bacterium]
MSVFDAVVGQARALDILQRAVRDSSAEPPGPGMTHAWLFTGPPGSGRSVAARAFAAALVCPDGGCGVCPDCHTAMLGSHADVDHVATEAMTISVDTVRSLVLEAAAAPSVAKWRVIVLEDADRLTEAANNALLKSLEEPTPHTVWLLCAPSLEDLLPTIRSRCRHVVLTTPSTQEVAQHLVERDGVDDAMAAFAARASMGHIGRARGLARDEQSRLTRAATLSLPMNVSSLGSALLSARELVDAAAERGAQRTKSIDETERAELARGMGVENPERPPAWARSEFKRLKDAQEKRRKRATIDELDRDLQDLLAFYRDVLVVQVNGEVTLVNAEQLPNLEKVAQRGSPETTMQAMQAILEAREKITAYVTPLLAVEEMVLTLRAS